MNKHLNEQIKYFFGKSFDEMIDDEKMEITTITLSSENFRGDPTDIDVRELLSFPNLKKCLLQGFKLSDEDIAVLNRLLTLRGIQFTSCSFEGITSSLHGVELVVLDGCRNVPYSLLKGLESMKYLRVVNQNYFDAAVLRECQSLERAYLQKTTISNLGVLRKLPSLKLVNLDGSRFNLLALHKLKGDMNVEYSSVYTPEMNR